MRRLFAAFLMLMGGQLAPALAQTPVSELAQPPANAETWVIVSAAGQHGQSWRWTAPDGTKVAWFHDPDLNLLSLVQNV